MTNAVAGIAAATIGALAAGLAPATCLGQANTCEPALLVPSTSGFEGGLVHVLSSLEWAGSNGVTLVAGGSFTSSGGGQVLRAARVEGSTWTQIGSGLDADVLCFAAHGGNLYVGGAFAQDGLGTDLHGVARLDGTTWQPVAGGFTGSAPAVRALVSWDSDGSGPNQSELIAGGSFTGGAAKTLNYIARFDGTEWQPMNGGMDFWVWTLAEFDTDGAGPSPPELYAGGPFQTAGGKASAGLARWNGATWTPVNGLAHSPFPVVYSLKASAVGSPIERLIVGGRFSTAGGLDSPYAAAWTGSAWEPLGKGLGGPQTTSDVFRLVEFDEDGSGPRLAQLIAAGLFTPATGSNATYLARLDGGEWTAFSDVPSTAPLALCQHDILGRQVLAVGGDMTMIGQASAERWGLYGCPCYSDCDESGTPDFFDFLCFQNAFAFELPYADCDGSGVLDFFDFLCFQNAFAAGCP